MPTPAGAAGDTVCFVEGTSESVSWARRYPVHGADLAAAREWALTARAVAAAVCDEVPAIIGEGALAALIRLAVPTGADPVPPPRVAIDTTGTAAGISAALQQVQCGGTVMLAARPSWTTTPIRTYHDLHRPGVALVTVPWASGVGRAAPAELVAWALTHLATVAPGRPVPPAPWYRVVVGDLAGDPVNTVPVR